MTDVNKILVQEVGDIESDNIEMLNKKDAKKYCNLCKKIYSVGYWPFHVKSYKHIERVNKQLELDGVEVDSDEIVDYISKEREKAIFNRSCVPEIYYKHKERVHCTLCNKSIYQISHLQHLNSNVHLKNVKEHIRQRKIALKKGEGGV